MRLLSFFCSATLYQFVQSFAPSSDAQCIKRTFTCRCQLPNEVVENEKMPRRIFLVDFALTLIGLNALQSPAHGMTSDKKTGIALPDPGEIEKAIPDNWEMIDNPFDGGEIKSLFGRLDTQPDNIFYADPRFVEHVDNNAVRLLSDYVSNEAIGEGDSVLDLCSSWTSHFESTQKNVNMFAGLGMNAKEMEANAALTEFVVQDLNRKPELPYRDGSFDTIICQLSIDYLVSPLQVMQEASRVLRPGGKIHILFSNRLFLSKAVGLWTGADDVDHAFYVGSYLHFSGGDFVDIAARDLSTRKGKQIIGDPVYVVTASKKAELGINL